MKGYATWGAGGRIGAVGGPVAERGGQRRGGSADVGLRRAAGGV